MCVRVCACVVSPPWCRIAALRNELAAANAANAALSADAAADRRSAAEESATRTARHVQVLSGLQSALRRMGGEVSQAPLAAGETPPPLLVTVSEDPSFTWWRVPPAGILALFGDLCYEGGYPRLRPETAK